MEVELTDFTVHLGDHTFGLEGLKNPLLSRSHMLSEPEEGIKGTSLPFITFLARDKEAADQFIRRLNYTAAVYGIDSLDLSNLVYAADKLTGG